MRSYTITPIQGAANWSAIPALPIDVQLWGTKTDITAQAQLCYDSEALHVRLSATEAHIRAEETGPLGSPCQDSCLEFFFCPMEDDRRYFNIEFNPNGCMYLGFGNDRYTLIRLVSEKKILVPDIRRTSDGWELFYSIPFAFIRNFFPGFEAKAGKVMRANFYKCGDLTVNEHYLSWNPIDNPKPNYHLPDYFAPITFG